MNSLQQESIPFYVSLGLFMLAIMLFTLSSINNSNETRDFNFERINTASSCTELNIFYNQALDFESGFSNHSNRDKITDIFISKVKELDCR
jgi:hypothetical protein